MPGADEIVIGDHNAHLHAEDPEVGGERKTRGLIPRDYSLYPVGHYAGEVGMHAVEMPLIPRAEWSARIKAQIDTKTRLSDFRMRGGPGGGMIPSRDQNGRGYCWRHSGTSAHLLIRARDEMPYVDLSPYAGACRIKNYRDEGGWGAQGLDDIMTYGDPTSEFWPQRATDRKYDTPATWANAKLHRITEGWIDMSAAQYDRKLSFEQTVSCLLVCVPVVVDMSWWSHSIAAADAVDGVSQWGITRAESGKLLDLQTFESVWGVNDPVTGGTGIRIHNSWGDSWSDQGMGVLTGSKAVPDGAVAPRVATWTAA